MKQLINKTLATAIWACAAVMAATAVVGCSDKDSDAYNGPTEPDKGQWIWYDYLSKTIKPGVSFIDYVAADAPNNYLWYPNDYASKIISEFKETEESEKSSTDIIKAMNDLEFDGDSAVYIAYETARIAKLNGKELLAEHVKDIRRGIGGLKMVCTTVNRKFAVAVDKNESNDSDNVESNDERVARIFSNRQSASRAADDPVVTEICSILGITDTTYFDIENAVSIYKIIQQSSDEEKREFLIESRKEYVKNFEKKIKDSDAHNLYLTDTYLKKEKGNMQTAKTKALTDNLIQTMLQRINNLDWMSDATKQEAQKKVNNIYQWYGLPKSSTESFLPTYDTSARTRYDMLSGADERVWTDIIPKYLGQSINDDLVYLKLSTGGETIVAVNAFYNPYDNSIIINPIIQMYPFMLDGYNEAHLYGCIGSVIGHEICHCLDVNGSTRDENGNKRNWWTDADKTKYQAKMDAMVELYNGFEFAGHKVDGKKTLAENMADFGGVTLALNAFTNLRYSQGYRNDDLKEEQRKFLTAFPLFFNVMDDRTSPEFDANDDHAPHPVRVNGVASLVPEWYDIFQPDEVSKYYLEPDKRIVLW